MKRLMMLLIIAVCAVTNTYAGELSAVKISGYFLRESNVSYELCLITEEGECIVMDSGKKFRTYELELDLEKYYSLTFTTKEGITKELIIEISNAAYIEVDVNFKNDNTAVIYSYKNHYVLHANKEKKEWIQQLN